MPKTSTAKYNPTTDPALAAIDPPLPNGKSWADEPEMVRMASNRRFGNYVCRGPVTGKSYTINVFGTGDLVDLEDAEIIEVTYVPCRCLRTGDWIEAIPAGIVR